MVWPHNWNGMRVKNIGARGRLSGTNSLNFIPKSKKNLGQNIRRLFRAPNFIFVVTEISNLNQMNPYHNVQPCIFKTHFNVMFPFTSRSYGWWRILKITDLHLLGIFPVTDISYMYQSTTLSWSQLAS